MIDFIPKDIKPKGFSLYHSPSDLKIWDICWLQDGRQLQIKEIRKIKRHAVIGEFYQFISRDDESFSFNEIEWLYDESI